MVLEYGLSDLDVAVAFVSDAILANPMGDDAWKEFDGGRVVALDGVLGSGKTTLIAGLCAKWGVRGAVTSPTFTLLNEYLAPGFKVYHFDFYRVEGLTEALDMGAGELIGAPGSISLIEWPGVVCDILPSWTVVVNLEVMGASSRRLTVDRFGWRSR